MTYDLAIRSLVGSTPVVSYVVANVERIPLLRGR